MSEAAVAYREATETPTALLEKVLIGGDLSKLADAERLTYYKAVCESVGLNPLTQPFSYITLNSKLTLYATKACTDQLRAIRGVSITITGREQIGDCYVVTARATTPDGRSDESTGVVAIGNLKGDALGNALMRAETKAKRRVTLSICGLGMLDETEIEAIPVDRKAMPTPTTPQATESVPPAEKPVLSDHRKGLIEAAGKAFTRLADAPAQKDESWPKTSSQMLKMACTELGIEARSFNEIADGDLERIAAWADTQAKIRHNQEALEI